MLFFMSLFGVFVIDRLSKIIVVSKMALYDSIAVLENIFHLSYVQNKGIAFGFFKENAVFSYVFTCLGFAILLFMMKSLTGCKRLKSVAAGMMVGGAIGNLIDRIIYGAVIDFLDFRVWPVFNVADVAISLSAFLLVFVVMKSDDSKKTETVQEG